MADSANLFISRNMAWRLAEAQIVNKNIDKAFEQAVYFLMCDCIRNHDTASMQRIFSIYHSVNFDNLFEGALLASSVNMHCLSKGFPGLTPFTLLLKQGFDPYMPRNYERLDMCDHTIFSGALPGYLNRVEAFINSPPAGVVLSEGDQNKRDNIVLSIGYIRSRLAELAQKTVRKAPLRAPVGTVATHVISGKAFVPPVAANRRLWVLNRD